MLSLEFFFGPCIATRIGVTSCVSSLGQGILKKRKSISSRFTPGPRFTTFATRPSNVTPMGMLQRPCFQLEMVLTKKGAPSAIRLLSMRPMSFVVMEEFCAEPLVENERRATAAIAASLALLLECRRIEGTRLSLLGV